ncbi:hypothetical protein [Rubripirellula lacrimiformis]|nr:hypothetical protein [Rubripirellula lacrimiformis]
MTDDITLCWHADRTAESFPATGVVIDRLLEIGLGTTPDNGLAVVIAKPNGQEMVVVIAGDRWCLDWLPADYHEQGCVGSFHTVAANQDASDYIVTYYLQGHHSECIASQTIAKEDAIRAICLFLASVQQFPAVG